MKVGCVDLEEAQRVADEELVFVVAEVVRIGDAGRGGQADLDAVEVLEHAAPLAVDAAVALVGDHEVEVARRVVAIDVHHALQRGDGDALFVLEAPAGAQDIGREVRQVLGEGVLGLLGQRDAVDQEQHAGDRVGLEQALDEARRPCGSCRCRSPSRRAACAGPALISRQSVSMQSVW